MLRSQGAIVGLNQRVRNSDLCFRKLTLMGRMDGPNPGRESAVYCKCPVMKCLMSNSENRGRSPPSGCLGSGFSKTPCTGWTCGVGDRERAVTAGEIVPHVFPQISVLLTIRTGNDIGNDLIQSLPKCID